MRRLEVGPVAQLDNLIKQGVSMHLIEMVLGYGIVSVRNKVIKNKQLAACRYV